MASTCVVIILWPLYTLKRSAVERSFVFGAVLVPVVVKRGFLGITPLVGIYSNRVETECSERRNAEKQDNLALGAGFFGPRSLGLASSSDKKRLD